MVYLLETTLGRVVLLVADVALSARIRLAFCCDGRPWLREGILAVEMKTHPPGSCDGPPGNLEGRVLIVNDDHSVRRALHGALVSAGFDVAEAASGEEALALEGAVGYDVVLLSLRIQGASGIEICRQLRGQFPHLAILALGVSETEEEEVGALESGADDYIAKPSPTRVIAHVRAAIRRAKAPLNAGRATISIGEIELRPIGRVVYRSSTLVQLTPKQFDLLHYLMAHAGVPITHAQLLSAVWGADHEDRVEYLRTFVQQLRKRLGDDSRPPKYIQTHPYIGYRFAGEEHKA
jgi:two-component system KDP operon response regulator KdpE